MQSGLAVDPESQLHGLGDRRQVPGVDPADRPIGAIGAEVMAIGSPESVNLVAIRTEHGDVNPAAARQRPAHACGKPNRRSRGLDRNGGDDCRHLAIAGFEAGETVEREGGEPIWAG